MNKRHSETRIQYHVTFTENYGFNVMSLTNTAKVAKIWPKKVYIHFLHIFSQILNGHMTIFGQVWFWTKIRVFDQKVKKKNVKIQYNSK